MRRRGLIRNNDGQCAVLAMCHKLSYSRHRLFPLNIHSLSNCGIIIIPIFIFVNTWFPVQLGKVQLIWTNSWIHRLYVYVAIRYAISNINFFHVWSGCDTLVHRTDTTMFQIQQPLFRHLFSLSTGLHQETARTFPYHLVLNGMNLFNNRQRSLSKVPDNYNSESLDRILYQ